VVPVAGGPFSLLDRVEQAQVLDGWRRALTSVGRTGSPVLRFQWIQSSGPRRAWSGEEVRSGELGSGAAGSVDAAAALAESARSYRELMGSDAARPVDHQAWLVVLVGSAPTRTFRSSPAAVPGRTGVPALRRELRLLHGQLTAAGLRPGPVLDPAGLRSLLSSGTVGDARGPAPDAGPRWPLASEDRWASFRADGLWHVTYWIAEWPRVEVGPDFLGPLLLVGVRATVSVVMAPVSTDRAVREVRSARTADAADTELRARAGFLPNARRQRESEGVVRRESELVDGHQEFRFSGYLTVSAPEPGELTAACAEAEQAAHAARLDLRRLYGRQAEAFTWTRPFGRGLR